MSENKSNGISIGFFGLLALMFIGLKITGFITWSWLWVLSPIWIPIIIVIAICVIIIIGVVIFEIFKKTK